MGESLTSGLGRAVGISGSPSPRSRSRVLLEHALRALVRQGAALIDAAVAARSP